MEAVRRDRDAELAGIDADEHITDKALADAILRHLHQEWRYERGDEQAGKDNSTGSVVASRRFG